MPLTKVKPESKLTTVRLNQHPDGVDLIMSFSDGQCHLFTLEPHFDRNDVARMFRTVAAEINHFNIH